MGACLDRLLLRRPQGAALALRGASAAARRLALLAAGAVRLMRMQIMIAAACPEAVIATPAAPCKRQDTSSVLWQLTDSAPQSNHFVAGNASPLQYCQRGVKLQGVEGTMEHCKDSHEHTPRAAAVRACCIV